MKIFRSLVVLFFATSFFFFKGYSQKRMLNWYFGAQVGLEFDCDLNVTETGLMDVVISEGGTCISDDDDGSLLYYVNPSRQLTLNDTNASKKNPGISC